MRSPGTDGLWDVAHPFRHSSPVIWPQPSTMFVLSRGTGCRNGPPPESVVTPLTPPGPMLGSEPLSDQLEPD